MTADGSMLKRLYNGVALFAILHLVVLGGVGAVLAGGGYVDAAKLQQIGCVLRGDDLTQTAQSEDQAIDESANVAEDQQDGGATRSEVELEVFRREADRIREELRQRVAQTNAVLLSVSAAREAFRREREESLRKEKTRSAQRKTEGFKKQLQIYENLKPKVAVEHLLSEKDPTKAAEILASLGTRKAKKIVEAARRGSQVERMKGILRQVGEIDPERSAALGLDKE